MCSVFSVLKFVTRLEMLSRKKKKVISWLEIHFIGINSCNRNKKAAQTLLSILTLFLNS